jgi:transposase
MSSKRYPEEFKIEAVRQMVERGHSVAEVASRLCDLLDVHPSSYYAWRKQPRSARAKENQRLTGLIKQFWLESGGVYGCRKIDTDLRDVGEHCSENRVYRLMQAAGLRSQVGYRRPRHRSGPVSVHAPNRLQQQFTVAHPAGQLESSRQLSRQCRRRELLPTTETRTHQAAYLHYS